MAPVGTHAASKAKAEQALRLRSRGHTWQEVADACGFRSRGSATKAVQRLILRDPPESVETKRTYTGLAYRQVTAKLFAQLEAAQAENDHAAVASLGRAIGEIQEKHAKLTGQHVVVAKEVEVNHHVEIASTARGVVDQAEQDLLAIAAGHRDAGMLPVIDAEVIEEGSPV